MLIGSTLAAPDAASADVRIRAVVDPSLTMVRGTLWFDGERGATFVDPLAALPEPADDLHLLRTYPGAPNGGSVQWHTTDDGALQFEATLPRRYGAVGSTRFGLFANGAWYPQPMIDGQVPEVRWDVKVALPTTTTGVVGTSVGQREVRWAGRGERASLAVLPRAHTTSWTVGETRVVLVTRRPRRGLRRELAQQLALVPDPRPHTARSVVVVVEAPLRRRLVRHGPGLAYLSDRAFRLTPGAKFAHRRAVVRGLLAAWVSDPDPQEREVAAAVLADAHADALHGRGADQLLGMFRWVPQINQLLASQRTPFYAEILDRVHPADSVADDLLEVLDPYVPGAVVAAQIEDRYGTDARRCLGTRVLHGASLEAAAAICHADPVWVATFRGPYPDQDYHIEIRGPRVVIDRDAPPEAPDEIVSLDVDGERQRLLLAPGTHHVDLRRIPRRVILDADRHTAQRSRVRDAWPPRYDITVAAGLTSLNVSQLQLFGGLYATVRRQYDTHNLLIGSVSNSRSDLVSVDLAFLRKQGPLLDGWRRPHRIQFRGGVSVFNPGFATIDAQLGLDAGISWAHDNRVNTEFPVAGHRVSLAVNGGLVPGTNDAWIQLAGRATGVVSPHPRQAFAGVASAAVAQSALPQRRLTLGGASVMRSIPTLRACPDEATPDPCTRLADQRAFVAGEYRVAALRGQSVPLGLLWGSELQVAVGLEAIVAQVDRAPVWATGGTFGLHTVVDALGAEPMDVGLTAAWPLAFDPALVELERSAVPEVYLRLDQAF